MLGFASTRSHWFLGIACASVGVFWLTPGLAQITPDSTLPNNSNGSILSMQKRALVYQTL